MSFLKERSKGGRDWYWTTTLRLAPASETRLTCGAIAGVNNSRVDGIFSTAGDLERAALQDLRALGMCRQVASGNTNSLAKESSTPVFVKSDESEGPRSIKCDQFSPPSLAAYGGF